MADNTSDRIDVALGANIKGLVDGFTNAGKSVEGFSKNVTGQVAAIAGTFTALAAPIAAIGAAIGAVLGGGELFKASVSGTVEWTEEIKKLARQLGITTEQASVLDIALKESFVSVDQYERAVNAMTRRLAAGGQGLRDLGVATTDGNGHLRASIDIMTDTIDKLAALKAGTDRNVAGQKIFSRAWAEVQPIILLTSERMREAKERAEALGIVLGPDAVARSDAYRRGMEKVSATFLGIKIAIGEQVLPLLTTFGEWFASSGPTFVEAFRVAMKVAAEVVLFVGEQFMEAYEKLKAFAVSVTLIGKAIASAWESIKSGSPGEAASTISAAATVAQMAWDHATENIMADRDKLWAAMQKVWNPPAPAKSAAPTGGTVTPPEVKDDSMKLVEKWKTELEEKKALEENWFTWSVGRELEFWQEKLDETVKGTNAYRAILTEVNKLRREGAIQSHDATLDQLKAEQDAAYDDGQKKIAIQHQIIDEEIRIHGEGSKEVEAARRKLADIEITIDKQVLARRRAIIDEEVTLDMLRVDAEQDTVDHLKNIGEISDAEALARAQNLADQRYAIQRQGITDQLALDNLTVDERRQLYAQLEQLDQQHANQFMATQNRIQESLTQPVRSAVDSMVQTWGRGLDMMLHKQLSFRDAVRGLFKSIVDAAIQAFIQMTVAFIAQKIKELIFHQATMTEEVVASKAAAAGEIPAQAGIAGAAAMASAAAIPYVGWAMAIPAGMSVMAAALSMLGVASAAGGFDVPANLNPMTQIHAREMVLPAKLADVVRRAAELPASARQAAGVPIRVEYAPQRGTATAPLLDLSPLTRALSGGLAALKTASVAAARLDIAGTINGAAQQPAVAAAARFGGAVAPAPTASSAPVASAFSSPAAGGDTYNIHVHAADAEDVRRLFDNHESVLVAKLRELHRNRRLT